ncbi:MAG: hypothetical protein A2V66_09205 [Ignavibacteria bacterium RBG_13_36_8]|nr:MAG: hypothetical protein A2V66_09205 [Ignavibacteria bacterium RBG_13_36_8]
MKSKIFSMAISNRQRIRFIYGLKEIILEPYYISVNKKGKKALFGRIDQTSEIKMFQYDNIFNIRVLNSGKFSPIIPIMQACS